MDFDIDAAALAWDGTTVRALPRAVRALATGVLLGRPEVLQHDRNRRRVWKYTRRGFRALFFDPMSVRPCVTVDLVERFQVCKWHFQK